jgi:lysozyme
MRCGEDGLRIIRAFERFFPAPYLCPAGWWTYGYGAVWDLEGHRVVASTPPLTGEDQGELLLARDVRTAERAVARFVRVPLAQAQFDALCSWTFNLGSGNLQASTLRTKVNREEHDEVPDEFRRWVYGGGRKLAGLVRRREAEAALYARGTVDALASY